ncbi:hypothetical protein ALC60_01750 [Trachymyrmex zeteki]|uniref:Uncharacterized protein n=1 Tax=Mycetomoellerius zeteki TaxID=64791 RepID=A0A151XFQ5_9HYME|nr:hypothetical protein ALC60_01750 [Trachymyrmex zeteki]
MASFEVGSENASTMAGSVLRDERARSEGDRDEEDRHWTTRGGWRGLERRKRSEACHGSLRVYFGNRCNRSGARRLLLVTADKVKINALKSRHGDSMYHKRRRAYRAANIGGIDKGMRERERSAIGLETAALIDATGKREYTCEGNSGDSAVFEYAGEKRKRK